MRKSIRAGVGVATIVVGLGLASKADAHYEEGRYERGQAHCLHLQDEYGADPDNPCNYPPTSESFLDNDPNSQDLWMIGENAACTILAFAGISVLGTLRRR